MKNVPKYVYLNTGVQKSEFNDMDFKELVDVSWSAEEVGEGDIPYVVEHLLNEADETIKFLCNMIMEQHDFRNNVLRSMSTGNHEEAHETVKMKFPISYKSLSL